jgi:hypothetical protein
MVPQVLLKWHRFIADIPNGTFASSVGLYTSKCTIRSAKARGDLCILTVATYSGQCSGNGWHERANDGNNFPASTFEKIRDRLYVGGNGVKGCYGLQTPN